MTVTGWISALTRKLLVGAIRVYQLIVSPLLPSACRFHPTCSRYMMDSVTIHGVFRGTWLGVKRLARCHPWNPGGHDPVPPRVHERD